MNQVKILVLLAIGLLSSCAAFDPYKPIERVYNKKRVTAGVTDIDNSVAYARDAQAELLRFIGDRNRELDAFRGSSLWLAAAMIADAAIDSSDDFLIIGSIVGATGYSMVDLQDRTERPELFSAAINAIDCGIEIISPLNALNTEISHTFNETVQVDQYKTQLQPVTQNISFTQLISRLKRSQQQLLTAKFNLTYFLRLNPSEGDREFLKDAIALADATHGSSQAILTTAVKLQIALAAAPQKLEEHVFRVTNELVRGVVATEKDIGALNTQLQGLVVAATQFSGLPVDNLFAMASLTTASGATGVTANESTNEEFEDDESKVGGQEVKSTVSPIEIDYKQEFQRLAEAIASSDTDATALKALVQSISDQQSAKTLKSCGLDVESILPPLKTKPASIEFTVGEGGKNGFTMEGGGGKYVATLVGDPDHIKLHQNGTTRYINIEVGKEAAAGKYRVEVLDPEKSGTYTTALVIVKQKTVTQTIQNEDGGKRDYETKPENCADSSEYVCQLQQTLIHLGYLPLSGYTGICDESTEKALAEAKKELKLSQLEGVDCSTSNDGYAANLIKFGDWLSDQIPKGLVLKEMNITDGKLNISEADSKENRLKLLTYLLEKLLPNTSDTLKKTSNGVIDEDEFKLLQQWQQNHQPIANLQLDNVDNINTHETINEIYQLVAK